MSDNSDAVRGAAIVLIKECLQRRALQEALRDGIRLRGPAASTEVRCTVEPALVERTRCVVRADAVTVEIFDPTREAWGEIYRSTTPDVIPAATEASPEPPSSSYGPIQPGQLLVVDGRFTIAK